MCTGRSPRFVSQRLSPCRRLLIEIVDQFARLDAKTMRQLQEVGQSRLATAALDPADARAVDAARVRESVLADAFARPQFLHAFAEGAAGSLCVVVKRCGHRGERGGSRPLGPERSGRERIGLERIGRVTLRRPT